MLGTLGCPTLKHGPSRSLGRPEYKTPVLIGQSLGYRVCSTLGRSLTLRLFLYRLPDLLRADYDLPIELPC